MAQERNWQSTDVAQLGQDSLRALLKNEIPAIRIPRFATDSECATLVMALDGANFKLSPLKESTAYLGIAHSQYPWGCDFKEVTAAVAEAYADQAYVFTRSFDPVVRIMEILSGLWNGRIEIASEEGIGRLFAGVIIDSTSGVDLHADFARYVSTGYAIANCDAQLAWNVYVEIPEAGGETIVYDRPWTPLPTDDRPGPAYDLSRASVTGAECVTLRPRTGDVLLFNARNPHEVRCTNENGGRRRIAAGSFIGSLRNGLLVLWS
jgi:hypothetical protein